MRGRALDSDIREAILDKRACGLSKGLIAIDLGLPPGTISSVLYVARQSGDPRAAANRKPTRRIERCAWGVDATIIHTFVAMSDRSAKGIAA